jgi:uncharacterized protein (DUF1800 family)
MKRFTVLAATLLLLASAKDNTLTTRQRALHALDRLSFGARPGDADRVLAIGVDAWIERQLHPERIADDAVNARLQEFSTLSMSDSQLMQRYYMPMAAARKNKTEADVPADQRPRVVVEELHAQRILRAALSERQLNEVMVDFWMNHFNVFAGKGIDRFLLTSYERDVIRPHVWGRFEDLLLATAKSPAMLFYLDNARSRRGGVNENYARELMELHTLGVDGGYSQQDVTELARVLTGWSLARPREGDVAFVFRRAQHDSGAKLVLGNRIAAGGGIEEGERMIRFLAHQPATAHHIALQLCQRLVADDPPPALVDRVAKRFLANGGDLRDTVKTIIDSREFWDPAVYRAKVKTPFEYVVSAVRAVGARIVNPLPLARGLQQLGEPLYGAQPPTGYSDRADAWMNTGALMNRLNFALALAANKLPGVETNLSVLVAAGDDPLEPLARALTGGELSPSTRTTIRARLDGDGGDARLPLAAGLILGSPEFQRQ